MQRVNADGVPEQAVQRGHLKELCFRKKKKIQCWCSKMDRRKSAGEEGMEEKRGRRRWERGREGN